MKRALFQPLGLLLSWRYIRASDIGFRFLTKTSVIGLIVSITVLLVVQGIVAGFQRDLDRNVLTLVPHVTFSNPAGVPNDLAARVVNQVPEVKAALSVIQVSGFVSNANSVQQAQLVGIMPKLAESFTTDRAHELGIAWHALKPGEFGILLGKGIARDLDVIVDDQVTVTFAIAGISPFGYTPRQKLFKVVGVTDTQTSLDSMVAYVHRDDSKRLLRLANDANAAYFQLHNPMVIGDALYSMYAAANERNLLATTWQDVFGALSHFLQRFKNLLFLLLSLLVAVATFNLVSSTVMLVYGRRADVAVLRTLGGSNTLILSVFAASAWVIAIGSLVICIALAWLIGLALPTVHAYFIQLLGVSLSEGFPLHRLTVVLQSSDVTRVIGLTLVLVTLGSLYPAWQAVRLAPAEILRDE